MYNGQLAKVSQVCFSFRCLIPYFKETPDKYVTLVELKLESCDLTCSGVCELLEALSSLRKPLNFLSIGGNTLGRFVK